MANFSADEYFLYIGYAELLAMVCCFEHHKKPYMLSIYSVAVLRPLNADK